MGPSPPRPLVDVAINVLGKPYQTAVTLFSLLETSGAWIDRIHVALLDRASASDHKVWSGPLRDRIVLHRPVFRLGVRPVHVRWPYRWRMYRHAVRYQRAWERTTKDHLFITHNDVRYEADLIGAMLARAGTGGGAAPIAVGPVGQCWNCPAHAAGLCGPERYEAYRPDAAEWAAVMRRHPGARMAHYPPLKPHEEPWPLPECRVNEWSALINMRVARPVTMPVGNAVPLGAFHGLDVGTAWFREVMRAGHRVMHFDTAPFARHAWASSGGNGHAALLDRAEYERSEAKARALWLERYGG